jgi:purple acid phosphatase-like protein/calcineurin-like phosphoesterase family protein/flagellar hook capping protein FlgD
MMIRGIALSAIGVRRTARAGPASFGARAAAIAPASVAAFIALAAFTTPASALTLTRHPWISLLTPTSALIAWQTDAAAGGTVSYGTNPQSLTSVQSHPGTTANHSVPLTGLSPGTTYFYSAESGGVASPVYSFRTAPGSGGPFRFVAFGDLGRATPEQKAVAARVDSLDADLGILTGDIIYEAGEAANFTPQYFDIYRPTIARAPYYPCLGNHDTGTSNGQPYLDAFYLPSNNPAATERYYSFDYANAHFVSIECSVQGASPGASMLSWLDADLAATTKLWKFVFFHIPIYSNPGVHGSDTVIRAALEPILSARHVDIAFQGHNHYYTRTYPILSGAVVASTQEPNYLNPGGTIYVVTGGGGRSLYALSGREPFEAFSKSTYHATVVDVFGATLSLKAVERDGTVIDAMTLIKDPPTAAGSAEGARDAAPRLSLEHARPNPSVGGADFALTLDRDRSVRVAVLDAQGRLVRALHHAAWAAGRHPIRWDGRDGAGRPVAAGLYFVTAESAGRRATVRIVLLR